MASCWMKKKKKKKECIPESNLFFKSNKVNIGTQLTQSAIEYCTVIGL